MARSGLPARWQVRVPAGTVPPGLAPAVGAEPGDSAQVVIVPLGPSLQLPEMPALHATLGRGWLLEHEKQAEEDEDETEDGAEAGIGQHASPTVLVMRRQPVNPLYVTYWAV